MIANLVGSFERFFPRPRSAGMAANDDDGTRRPNRSVRTTFATNRMKSHSRARKAILIAATIRSDTGYDSDGVCTSILVWPISIRVPSPMRDFVTRWPLTRMPLVEPRSSTR